MRHTATLMLAIVTLALAVSSPARAADSLGINAELGFASMYMFRGYNVFQEDSQSNQNMMLAPGVAWTASSIPLTIGYWGAFQLNGDNRSALIDSGMGAEQDLYASYGISLTETMGLSAGLTYYFYPLADEDDAGTSMPSYLEPALTWSFASAVDIAVKIAWFHGLQDAVSDFRYLYINPVVSKGFTVAPWLSLGVAAGFGYKRFSDADKMKDNVYEATLGVVGTIPLGSMFYIKPGVNAAWTNFEARDFSDELGVFGTLTIGANL